MMLLTIIATLLLTFHDVYSSVKHAECRIVYDKFHRQEMASRNFIAGAKWPNNEVPYEISSGYSSSDLDVIKSAMREIESKTCVKWVPRSGQKSFVLINPREDGCFAVLGYNPNRGMHVLNLQRSNGRSTCMIMGIAAHEMLHILGFAHEQTRPDRDQFVQIYWSRIKRDSISNYFRAIDINARERPPVCDPRSTQTSFDNCYSGFKTRTFGLEYDYGSIMHYGLDDFTTTGQDTMRVLRPVPTGIVIGNRKGMTNLDALKVKMRYDCNEDPEKKTTRKPSVECKDIYRECPLYKNQCKTNQFIKDGCKVSCGECTECYDMYRNCPDMKHLCGELDAITKGCKLTCRLC
ncbi:hatching enzyme 1.2 [Lepeophtheirus salmonis]|nr:low choriolytic enzyme-like [Lepeophtheirus salmonis]XP_040575512.1 low choriolytic enzyme-like [Lepeophtheirus salmonis]XP_040575542.1 low choriolytic enzyme-like [Lepeophtheirus salmonis]